jgi:hypothetical protein
VATSDRAISTRHAALLSGTIQILALPAAGLDTISESHRVSRAIIAAGPGAGRGRGRQRRECGSQASRQGKEMTMYAIRLAHRLLVPATAGLLAVALLASGPADGQAVKTGEGKPKELVPAGYDDYQNMLDQLGIKKMRRGRDARVKDTSDEATANPYEETLPVRGDPARPDDLQGRDESADCR